MKKPTHVEHEDPVLGRITDAILSQGKMQKDLVEALGLKKGMYTAWKAGLSISYRKYLYQIADYLKVTPEYLLRGEETELIDPVSELLEIFRDLNDKKKKRLLNYARKMKEG